MTHRSLPREHVDIVKPSADTALTAADHALHREVQERMARLRDVLLEEVAAYPGGMEAWAAAVGTTAKRLQRAIETLGASSGAAGAKLGIPEFEAIARLTNSTRILQAFAGPEHRVVPLPAPSVDTQDPCVLFGSALRHFLIAGVAWAACFPARWREWLPAMGCMATFAELGAALGQKPTVAKNELRELAAKHLEVVTSIQHLAAVDAVQEPLLQAVADNAAAYRLVAAKLPTWARENRR